MKIFTENYNAADFEEKGLKTLGVRLCTKEVQSVKVEENQMELFN